MSWCGTKKAKKLLSMDSLSILVFDLETTGVDINNSEILQISLVDGNGNSLFSSYVKPKAKSWKMAQRVNGISPEMVKDAPSFDVIRPQIQGYFDNAKLVAGYNCKSFDIKIIERYGIVVPINRFDVMEEYRLYTGKVTGTKLVDCAAYFGESFTPHDAREDAAVTARCMYKLIREKGFINYTLPKSGKKKHLSQQVEPSMEVKLPIRSRILKPFLKKKRFHPLITGFLLLLISFSSITYLTYGWKALSSIETINFTQLLETVFKNQINLLFGVAFLVGIVLAFYALGSIAFAVGRYTINYIRKLIRKLLDWKKKT